MIVRPWNVEEGEEMQVEEASLEPTTPRLREHISPIGQIVGQNLLDAAVQELQAELASLHAEQERSLGSIGEAIGQLARDLNGVRAQLSAQASPGEAGPPPQLDGAELRLGLDLARERLARLERQASLLTSGLDAIDALRAQAEVHGRAIGRLTEIVVDAEQRLTELAPAAELRPTELAHLVDERLTERTARLDLRLLALERRSHEPNPAVEPSVARLEQAVAAIEQRQNRQARGQRVAFALLSASLAAGLGALGWLAAQGLGVAAHSPTMAAVMGAVLP